MSTAMEIRHLMEHSTAAIDGMRARFEDSLNELTDEVTHHALGRIVSAQRARFLRKRREDVRFHSHTSTGKARYRWTKSMKWALT